MKRLMFFLCPLMLLAVDPPTPPAPAPKVVKTDKLSKTETLALQALNDRQQAIINDSKEFSTDTCKAHGIPFEECSMDPNAGTISHVVRELPAKETPAKK